MASDAGVKIVFGPYEAAFCLERYLLRRSTTTKESSMRAGDRVAVIFDDGQARYGTVTVTSVWPYDFPGPPARPPVRVSDHLEVRLDNPADCSLHRGAKVAHVLPLDEPAKVAADPTFLQLLQSNRPLRYTTGNFTLLLTLKEHNRARETVDVHAQLEGLSLHVRFCLAANALDARSVVSYARGLLAKDFQEVANALR